MFKYLLCLLIIALVFITVHLSISKLSGDSVTENFESLSTDVDITHPDVQLASQSGELVDESQFGFTQTGISGSNNRSQGDSNSNLNMSDYVRKSDIERAARASTQKYCPVAPSYNPNDYIKKTEIDFAQACPKIPDLKDYVLKSTIPPVQKCPSCICPKVKVSAGMCKKCPEPKNTCPKPQPCNVEQCQNIIQCAPGDQQISCPKCPAPQPCPESPEKVCPAFELPRSDIKCPAPKPCGLPTPCPDKQGRCPEKPDSKCKYYGIKEIARERSVNDLVNEMLLSDDPKLKELLESLKYKLNINLAPSPTENLMTQPIISTTVAQTTTALIPTTSDTIPTTTPEPIPTTTPTPAPTTDSTYKEFNPSSHNNSKDKYEFNSYRYSSLNNLDFLGEPQPTYQAKIGSNNLVNSPGLGCDINDANCSYNTNLPI